MTGLDHTKCWNYKLIQNWTLVSSISIKLTKPQTKESKFNFVSFHIISTEIYRNYAWLGACSRNLNQLSSQEYTSKEVLLGALMWTVSVPGWRRLFSLWEAFQNTGPASFMAYYGLITRTFHMALLLGKTVQHLTSQRFFNSQKKSNNPQIIKETESSDLYC